MFDGAQVLNVSACPLTKSVPVVIWKDGVPEDYCCWKGARSNSRTPLDLAIRNLEDKMETWFQIIQRRHVRKIERIYLREVPLSHSRRSPRNASPEQITEMFREVATRLGCILELPNIPNLKTDQIKALVPQMGWNRYPLDTQRALKVGIFCGLSAKALEHSALVTYDPASGKLSIIGEHIQGLHKILKDYQDKDLPIDEKFVDRIYLGIAAIMSDPAIAMAQHQEHLQGLAGYVTFWTKFAESASRHVDRKVAGTLSELQEALANVKQGK